VDLQIELEVPQPPAEVWAIVRDMPRFACVDPFHQRVIVLGPALKPGVELDVALPVSANPQIAFLSPKFEKRLPIKILPAWG
jgi:hypothetical protein